MPTDAVAPRSSAEKAAHDRRGPTAVKKIARTGRDAGWVKSASRAIDVLEYAQRCRKPFKAVCLRSEFDWPASSTQELLRTLVSSGYLVFNVKTKQYFPSPRVLTLGAWLSEPRWNVVRMLHLLREIRDETGETVCLSVENEFGAQLVRLERGQTPLPHHFPDGYRAPLTTSAAGLALLTTKTDQQLISCVQRSGELLPAWGVLDSTIKAVHRFRKEGRAIVYGRLWPDSVWVSVPLPGFYNQLPVSISCGGSRQTMKNREDAVTSVMYAALSRKSG